VTWVVADPDGYGLRVFNSTATVRLLEEDPDLRNELAAGDAEEAGEQSVVRVLHVAAGQWRPPEQKRDPGAFGVYVVDGVLARNVTVGGRTCAELLGPGDILRPWVRSLSGAGSIESTVEWTATTETAMALLDGAFIKRMAHWPEVISALGDRVMLRTHWLAFHLAVCHMRRVDERVLIVLWHFADRWGHVTPSGVVIPLPLTHALLAKVVGAQRPTVSTAIADMQREGLVSRREDRTWVLYGKAPEKLEELRSAPIGNGRLDLAELDE
jgi:CRP/FNR family cyclic AMP-dependent transcriptional regulator